MFKKSRIEALSDAVFAIAMTLLILDIKVPPVGVEPGQLAAAIRADAHEWISFAFTFALSSLFWTYQHLVFDAIDEVGKEGLVLTFAFLAFVSVLPFSTSLWGHHLNERLAFVVYFANQFALAALLTAKLEISRVKARLHAGVSTDRLRLRLYSLCAMMASASLAAWLMPLKYVFVVPAILGVVGRLLRRRSAKRTARLASRNAAARKLKNAP
jgi:uncharacterized membrane protein